MILPTKKLRPQNSLIYVGSSVLVLLDDPKTVSRLWEEFQSQRKRDLSIEVCDVPFDWFVLGLNLLYLMGAIDLSSGRVVKVI